MARGLAACVSAVMTGTQGGHGLELVSTGPRGQGVPMASPRGQGVPCRSGVLRLLIAPP